MDQELYFPPTKNSMLRWMLTWKRWMRDTKDMALSHTNRPRTMEPTRRCDMFAVLVLNEDDTSRIITRFADRSVAVEYATMWSKWYGYDRVVLAD